MMIPLRITTNTNLQTGFRKNNNCMVVETTKRHTFGRTRRIRFASDYGSYSSRSLLCTQQRSTSSLLFANLMNQNESFLSRGGNRRPGLFLTQPFFRPSGIGTTIGTHQHQLNSSSTSKSNENDNNVKGGSANIMNTTKTTSQFMQELKGVSKSYDTSSTEYITHFIANENDTFTMESAIQSVLTRPVPLRRKHNHRHFTNQNMFVFDKETKEAYADDDVKYLDYDQDNHIDMNSWTRLLVDYEMNNPIVQSLEAKFRYDPDFLGHDDADNNYQDQLSPAELLALGSVWYLPHDAPRDPSLGGKPIRVELKDFHKPLMKGDYLRVHHSPKRFPMINQFDWGKSIFDDGDNEKDDTSKGSVLPGVIVKENPDAGYIIVNKPPGVPVHPTVDNVLENVAGAIGRALIRKHTDPLLLEYEKRIQNENNVTVTNRRTSRRKTKKDPLVYVATPQRLDQNTSGLFVAATSKSFAAYFAKLLRKKTDKLLNSQDDIIPTSNNSIQKKYRCLVCINGGLTTASNISMQGEYDRLKDLVQQETIVRHFLEPALKTPRTFISESDDPNWLECLLRIRKIGSVYPLLGSQSSSQLCNRLWGIMDLKPKDCVAVAEVEVELLTGRTHQIRGQLATLGFPLCGDSLYGGALTPSSIDETITDNNKPGGYKESECLCLQCCELSFRNPNEHDHMDTFRLEEAWWSTWLQEYDQNPTLAEATTGSNDNSAKIKAMQESSNTNIVEKRQKDISKIPMCQLSPGKNKYVIIKATAESARKEPLWFIRSASPHECGGPYHADVARETVSRLNQMGFETQVMGGGRIDFNKETKQALVYGFSYGFGKGDHEFVSLLIEKYDDSISASFDDSDLLY